MDSPGWSMARLTPGKKTPGSVPKNTFVLRIRLLMLDSDMKGPLLLREALVSSSLATA